MKRCLVIGAAGQIGSDLLPVLVQRGDDVWAADLRPASQAPAAAAFDESLGDAWRARWRVVDAADEAMGELVRELRPDAVFHLAALLSATGEKDPRRCWDVNMASLRIVLDALAERDDRPVLVWPSSIAVFGPLPQGRPYPARVPDEFPLLPTTMYGITKVAGELLGGYFARRYGVDFRSLRFPGLLSATPPGGGSSDFANMVYFAAARRQRAVTVFVRPDTRIPFLHMADAVTALLDLAQAPAGQLTRRVYNVTGFAPTAAEIAAAVAAAGAPVDVSYVPDHRQAIVDSWPDDLDDGPARADWGFRPRHDLAATTQRLLAEIAGLPASGAVSGGAH